MGTKGLWGMKLLGLGRGRRWLAWSAVFLVAGSAGLGVFAPADAQLRPDRFWISHYLGMPEGEFSRIMTAETDTSSRESEPPPGKCVTIKKPVLWGGVPGTTALRAKGYGFFRDDKLVAMAIKAGPIRAMELDHWLQWLAHDGWQLQRTRSALHWTFERRSVILHVRLEKLDDGEVTIDEMYEGSDAPMHKAC